ncbi:MAG: FAD-binding oxidoreductase, partial [Proteobacteria bacterium]|nr:FAD-binding oxidoreductase [Pseudomonadota bacterium]
YGSRVPTDDGSIILELHRLNRIVEYSEDLAYVTVEPGVTQQQLYSFLQAQKSKLWMDVTGGPANHSLIGNIAERGFGHTNYGDHFANVGGMQVMLPTGEQFNTGFGRYPNSRAKGLFRWGVGPVVDGLFTQSNLGIITQATIWLMPAPEYFQMFFFGVDEDAQLASIIDLLRPLRLDGTLRSAMHIGNDYKVLSAIRQYPWEMSNGQTPLTAEAMAKAAGKWDFGAWNGSGALYGSKREVALARRRLRKQLKGKVKSLRFIDERLIGLAEKLKKPYERLTGIRLGEMLKILKPVFDMTKGVPTDAMLPSTYWRQRQPPPATPNPDRDGCGLLWLSPVAPTDGKCAVEIMEMTKRVFGHHGFEPAVSITLITERAMDLIICISYDRAVEGEDRRAHRCHDELLQELTGAGFFPYRLGLQSMGKLPPPEPGYEHFIDKVKAALDPHSVLAPRRYREAPQPDEKVGEEDVP